MSKIFKNRTVRIFFLWYSCLFLIVGLMVTVIFIKEVRQEREIYALSLEEDVENIVNYLGQNLTASVNTCNSIFSSTWYKHYRNIANIYKDEFNGMKKIEIMDDIASKVTALPFVLDILVITPFPEQNVISKNGWFTFDDYDKIYGLVKIELSDNLTEPPTIRKASDSICFITLQDTTPRRIQSVICIIIDKKLFANTLKRIISERSVYVRAELNGQILYEAGHLDDTLVVNTANINMPTLSLTIGSPSYENSLMKVRTMNYILVMVIVLLAGAILSGFITMVVLKPLGQIIKRIGGNFRQLEDPYYFISEYVEISSEQNKRLSIEKENLNKSMERLLSLIRDEIFFGMLTNPNFNFHDEYTYTSIPWINDGHPYVLAVLEPKFQGESELPKSSVFGELAEIALQFCTFSILYNDICILLWFKDKDDANEKYNEVKDQITYISKGKYFLSFSAILQDTKSMGESYLMQKSEIAEQRHVQLDLPISFQIELISKLQKNKQLECVELLNKSKYVYNPNAIMQLLARIAAKYNIDSAKVVNHYYKCKKSGHDDEEWDVLINFAKELCKLINDVKNTSIDETVEVIRRYIDEHYCDPNLCMKHLADHFSMHRTLISKILKEHLGVTFTDYLLDLRMKKSMELLKNTEMNINEVGEAVGYENYISFKRAFLRYQGISPREFRIQFF